MLLQLILNEMLVIDVVHDPIPVKFITHYVMPRIMPGIIQVLHGSSCEANSINGLLVAVTSSHQRADAFLGSSLISPWWKLLQSLTRTLQTIDIPLQLVEQIFCLRKNHFVFVDAFAAIAIPETFSIITEDVCYIRERIEIKQLYSSLVMSCDVNSMFC